jgi:hypothetical protein
VALSIHPITRGTLPGFQEVVKPRGVENLRLKPREASLAPPGISVLKTPSPADAATQIRNAFPEALELHEASRVVGSTTALEGLHRHHGALTMADQTVKIIDRSRNPVATARVSQRDDLFLGEIELSTMPEDLLKRFEEYETLVNGQMFALLDDIEEQIDSLLLKVVLESGQEIAIEDLQIYPCSRRVSFKPKQIALRLSDVGPDRDIGHSSFQPRSEQGR